MTQYIYTKLTGRREIWSGEMLKQHAKNKGAKQKFNNTNEAIRYIMKVEKGSNIVKAKFK